MKQINKEITKQIISEMPEEKKQALRNACTRNGMLTSWYGLTQLTLRIYKEGFQVVMEGCRAKFSVWADDNDGEFVFRRKPDESKLHLIYSDGEMNTDFDYDAV